jgi:hypothetical protein
MKSTYNNYPLRLMVTLFLCYFVTFASAQDNVKRAFDKFINSKNVEVVKSFSEERDMIYGFIYELRKQVADLRNRVAELEGGQSHKSDGVAKVPAGLPAPKHLTTDIPVVTPSSSDYGSSDWIDVEDVEPSEGAHSAVEQAEKKMIEDALRKHHNRRKIVADALGMSERTLYRKIKKYGLE